MNMNANDPVSRDLAMEQCAAQMSMSWYGWGSPVGLGILLVAVGATTLLVSRAIWG